MEFLGWLTTSREQQDLTIAKVMPGPNDTPSSCSSPVVAKARDQEEPAGRFSFNQSLAIRDGKVACWSVILGPKPVFPLSPAACDLDQTTTKWS